MTADTKLFHGGDTAIIFTHTQPIADDMEISQQCNEVNDLIISCKTSKESLSKLYTMFKRSVFAIAFSITGDYHLSEDCVAETFVRLTQVKRFSAKNGDGRGFIFTVARNVAFEQRRRYRKNCVNLVIQSYGDADKTVEDSIFINQLLKNLNDKQRQIVVLKCYSGLTFKEIAVIMKSPESTIKSKYQKAINILKSKAGVI
ncbi:MAG: sigma-70 family RNA polymerase sigma factor [Ruminococcus sp.]|nr:sigma-70 family RNA polymerase sigma factor [Ruminococcus sp.]